MCVGLSSHAFSSNKAVKKAVKDIQDAAPYQQDYFSLQQAALQQKEDRNAAGSLWVDTYSSHIYDNMYRASRVGDTVMIVVAEDAQGEGSGNTKSNKKTEHTASVDELGGLMQKINGLITNLDPGKLIGASTESKFQGTGTTDRAGKLDAKLTATVTQVLRNGNMVIRGEQHLKLNKEDQVLIVEGIIRPYDIEPNNTVRSNSVADARITYSGFGVLGDRQSPGWLVKVLDKVWPF